jgi:uncharacterized protein
VIPAWPFWTLIVIGLLIALVGLAMTVDLPEMPAAAAAAGVWIAIGGMASLLVGLLGLAVRALLRRRHLPANRYRGPSVILLFIIVVVAGNLASIPLLPALVGDAPVDSLVISVILFLTPIAFLVVTWLLVLRPRAVVGLRLSDGADTMRNLVRGLVLGAGVWVVAMGVSAAAVAIWSLFGDPPDTQQTVVRLLAEAPPLATILSAGLAAPIAEEMFFRGVAFNAWLREYGRVRAIVGSAVLFAAVHMLDGAVLAFPPILVVGLALAIAYDRTRSLPLVIAAHAAFNLTSLALLYSAGA